MFPRKFRLFHFCVSASVSVCVFVCARVTMPPPDVQVLVDSQKRVVWEETRRWSDPLDGGKSQIIRHAGVSVEVSCFTSMRFVCVRARDAGLTRHLTNKQEEANSSGLSFSVCTSDSTVRGGSPVSGQLVFRCRLPANLI